LALQAAAEATGKVKIVESAAVYQLEQGGISKDNHNGSQPDQVPSTRGPLWAVSYKELNHRLDSPEPSSSFTVPSSRSGNNSQSSGDNSGQCSSSSVTVAANTVFSTRHLHLLSLFLNFLRKNLVLLGNLLLVLFLITQAGMVPLFHCQSCP